ncbi:MAG: NAD-dependent epimerase/dehydratase family protein, partial [Acidobacteriota bacterium]
MSAVPAGAGVRAYAGKTIAVTGASGFIGAGLVDRLTVADCQIIRVSSTEFGDPAAWHRAADADVVFHLAAQTSTAA